LENKKSIDLFLKLCLPGRVFYFKPVAAIIREPRTSWKNDYPDDFFKRKK
jgi:hypothetical protein